MPKYKIFAAIDIGSTKISMQIAKISKNTEISVINNVSCDIPIGRETYSIGRISFENVDKICSCLEKFEGIMSEYRVDDYSCYATTAIREAENSEYIIEQINIRSGLKVTILSNEEERFLHNKALALKTGYFDDIIKKSAVLADVSSGSVQISYYNGSELKFSENLAIGALRITEELSELHNEAAMFSELVFKYIKHEIQKLMISNSFNSEYEYAVFMGSHIPNIKKLCKIRGSDSLTYDGFRRAYKIITEKNPDEIAFEFDIPYDEVELMLPTILIFKLFTDMNKSARIIIPETALTDGICVEYAEKNGYTHTKHIFTNDILSSARYCAKKYKADTAHIEKSIEFCEQIFKALSKKYNLSKHDLILLKTAAIFSDTGIYISANDYNKYSSYIVKATPIIGLSNNDTDTIANIVLLDENSIDVPTKRRRLLVSKLSAILMIAKALDMEHSSNISDIKVLLKNNQMTINAYSKSNIIFETRKFQEARKSFENVFGIHAQINLIKKS